MCAHIVAQAQRRCRKLVHALRPVCLLRHQHRSIGCNHCSWSARVADARARFATVAGRPGVPRIVHRHAARFLRDTPSSTDLCLRKGRWYLSVATGRPVPDAPTGGEDVDLESARLAVTSKMESLGSVVGSAVGTVDFGIAPAAVLKCTCRCVSSFHCFTHHVATCTVCNNRPAGLDISLPDWQRPVCRSSQLINRLSMPRLWPWDL